MLFAENLNYSIKKNTLLRGINFSIRPGEFLAVLGANGAGKSTLIKLLSGEYAPSEGCIKLHGKSLSDYSDLQLAGMRATMMQQQHISADFTVEEVVLMGRYPHYSNRPREEDLEIVAQTMEITGISNMADRSVLSLSGGERQRVQLARILAQIWHQPNALLLLDEPVSAMDIRFQHQTLSIARALADKGWMVMAILHDINLASQYADRLLMMKNGRKLMDGTASEVLTSRNIYTVFAIDAEVAINPRTLHTYIVPKAIKIDLNRRIAHSADSVAASTTDEILQPVVIRTNS